MKISRAKFVENKGETLLESVLSVMLFAMLMVVVTTMIGTSIKISTGANAVGANLQNTANKAAQHEGTTEIKNITFKFGSAEKSTAVNVFSENGLISFYPKP